MKKGLLTEKIGSLRKSKGFTQEMLADKSSINLRTLQRIEAGETEPRGNTLRLIAQALGTPVEELLDLTKKADTGFLQIMNLATLSFWVIPLGNVFVPLIFWVVKRDKVQGVHELGRRIINFQITWCLITYGFILSWVVSVFGKSLLVSPVLFLPVVFTLYLFNSIIILTASWQIRRSRETVYSLSFPILR